MVQESLHFSGLKTKTVRPPRLPVLKTSLSSPAIFLLKPGRLEGLFSLAHSSQLWLATKAL